MGKTRKAANGSGSIWAAKDRHGRTLRDVWHMCYQWTDKATGERRREYATVHGSKTQAREHLEEMRARHAQGIRPDGDKITFAQFAGQWQEMRAAGGALARRSVDDSAQVVEYLARFIGETPITGITTETVERLYADIREDKRRANGTTIKERTMLKYHRYLKQIMQKACDYDYILRNPCARVKLAPMGEVDRRALSPADAQRLAAKLEESATEERGKLARKETRQESRGKASGRGEIRGLGKLANITGARLALATGLRLGELLGLTWGNVDTKKCFIRITQSLTQYGDTKKPKSAAGVRVVWIDASTARILDEWRAVETDYLRKLGAIKAGEGMRKTAFVVCSDSGGRSNINNYETWWRAWREKNGFPGLKLHELRHTQATLLLASGIDVKTVAARLGHSDASLTLKWYTHTLDDSARLAAGRVGGILDGLATVETA